MFMLKCELPYALKIDSGHLKKYQTKLRTFENINKKNFFLTLQVFDKNARILR